MELSQYQQQALTYAVLENPEDFVTYGVLNTASEAGEIAGKFAKSMRDKTELDREEVIKEMGDVLWSLAALAHGLGTDLNKVAVLNIYKLQDRQNRDVIAGSGDNR